MPDSTDLLIVRIQAMPDAEFDARLLELEERDRRYYHEMWVEDAPDTSEQQERVFLQQELVIRLRTRPLMAVIVQLKSQRDSLREELSMLRCQIKAEKRKI